MRTIISVRDGHQHERSLDAMSWRGQAVCMSTILTTSETGAHAMNNSLPHQDNPRGVVVTRTARRSPEASRTRSRISLRNLVVAAVAAAGLSIVPVGIATALPTAATAAAATYRVGDQDLSHAAVVNLDNGQSVRHNSALVRADGSDPYGNVEIVLPG